MKIQILFMFCLSLLCACQISQQAQSAENTNAVNSNQEMFTTDFETNLINAKNLKPADDSRFLGVKIKRTDKSKKYSLKINVEYPQLKKAKNQQEISLNQYIKTQVDKQLSDFNKFLVEKNSGKVSDIEYEINLAYGINYFSNDFVSISMDWDGYSGYLNQDYFPATINYDLNKGKVIKLKDLFEPDSKYLNNIAEESRKILKRICLSCGCGKEVNAGDFLPDDMVKEAERRNQNSTNANSQIHYQDSMFFERGTAPTEENYRNWSIVSEGLEITFGEYQVGPGCIGIIHIVIPFDSLKPILKKDLNFN